MTILWLLKVNIFEKLDKIIVKNYAILVPGRSAKRGHFFQNSIAPTKKLHDASTFDI